MTVELDAKDLMRQACMTAHDYLLNGIRDVDERLGSGYARAHPELLAAYMQTAATDLMTAVLAKEIGEAIGDVATAINGYPILRLKKTAL